MRETTVARTYAEALLEIARKEDAVELYAQNLLSVADLMETEREFRLLLETPRIDPAAKKQVLREVLAGRLPDLLLKFLFVVIEKHRQRLIPAIANEYAGLVDAHFGRVQVQITTATEPDDELRVTLQHRLGELLQKEVLPLYRIDARILGGVIIRIGDRIMNGSVRRRLQLLRRSLLKAEVT